MEPRDAQVCIIDSGVFLSIARAYGRQFNKPPFYVTMWERQFADGQDLQIGNGYDELIRVRTIWEVIDEVDLFIFLDVGHGVMQDALRRMGKRVFGPGSAGENLELKRWHFYQTIKGLGMPVPNAVRLVGVSALRKHLSTHDNQWVKISQFRGVEETFNSPNYLAIFPFLDWLESDLGARREEIEFVAYDPLDDCLELGYDGFCIDGEFPETAFFGYERKDKSYVMTVKPYGELPEEVRYMNDKIAPILKKIKYRGHYHTEGRVSKKDGKVYFTDITTRPGCPPGEIFAGLIDNLAEIAYYGAEGKVVEPKALYKYGVQAVIKTDFAEHNALTVSYPEHLADRVMLINSCVVDGVEWVIPTAKCEQIGYVTGLADDLEEAIVECQEVAKEFVAFRAKIDTDEVAAAIKEILKGEEEGIHFSAEPLPDPADLSE
jgi:hypothetical protein